MRWLSFSLNSVAKHTESSPKYEKYVKSLYKVNPGDQEEKTKQLHEKMYLLLFSHCHAQLFSTPRTAARQASLSFTISWSLFKLMSIESVMPSNRLILCHPLLLLPSIFPSIRVFFNESSQQVPKVLEFQL